MRIVTYRTKPRYLFSRDGLKLQSHPCIEKDNELKLKKKTGSDKRQNSSLRGMGPLEMVHSSGFRDGSLSL